MRSDFAATLKGLPAGDDLPGARPDAVIADVRAPRHNTHALREALGALLVAGAELAQHREQGVADQRVDLVHQQHQRRRVGQAPVHQHVAQGGRWGRMRPGFSFHDLRRKSSPSSNRPRGHHAQDGADAGRRVVARYLGDFHVDVYAAEVAGFAAV